MGFDSHWSLKLDLRCLSTFVNLALCNLEVQVPLRASEFNIQLILLNEKFLQLMTNMHGGIFILSSPAVVHISYGTNLLMESCPKSWFSWLIKIQDHLISCSIVDHGQNNMPIILWMCFAVFVLLGHFWKVCPKSENQLECF